MAKTDAAWITRDGKQFVASERYAPETLPVLSGMQEDALRGWLLERWRRAYMAKMPELDMLKTFELYYSGIHYIRAEDNRANEVTNLCFSLVETVWANATEQLPTPKIVPGASSIPSEKANDLAEFATWLMRADQFESAYLKNQRAKFKYGTCYYIIVTDPATGVAYPRFLSPFDFYKDPAARSEEELQYYFIAGPVPTNWLRAMFPKAKEQIIADGIMSPSYDVLVRPYFEQSQVSGNIITAGATFPGFTFSKAGSQFTSDQEPIPNSTTSLVPSPATHRNADYDTTFLVQMFVRDYSKMPVQYLGEIVEPDPANPGTFLRSPTTRARLEPCCASGWRVLQMTATGAFLDPGSPLDPCFLGSNLVVGRDYWHEGRFYGTGELNHAIPLNRFYNRRKNLLNRSLEYEALPIMLMDEDAGTDIDERAAEPGEAIKKRRGSEVGWLTYNGVEARQFELLSRELDDFQRVTGVHDLQAGSRGTGDPTAGVAIRDLQRAAQTRIRGKENQQLRELATLLKKCMATTGKKASARIVFKGSHGKLVEIDPADLLMDYDIAWAPGSGGAIARENYEEKLLQYLQLGVVDPQAVLDNSEIPGKEEIKQRMAAREIAQMQMQAAAAAQPPAQGGPPK